MMRWRKVRLTGLAFLLGAFIVPSAAALDLANALVVLEAADDPIAENAARVLAEEVERRTGLRWPIVAKHERGRPAVVLTVGRERIPATPSYTTSGRASARDAETFYVRVSSDYVQIIAGNSRALLFGIGALIQAADWGQGRFHVPGDLKREARPAYPLRGHQLGYRARANSWDAWTDAQFEQHIRELALFGTNAIENIPFQDDDPIPHAKLSRRDMNRRISEICAQYGLQYWVWTPATFDLNDTEKRAAHLAEHEQLYQDCPRLDAVFFPGGDPGDNPPELVLEYLAELSRLLARHHPGARIWMSIQGFDLQQTLFVYDWVAEHRPKWLGGIVAGPSTPPLKSMRERLDPAYPIRDYPDITHTTRAQYPVPWWDPAFALTLGRECINPRPNFYADVIRMLVPNTIGFITYSDGVHDDVNKVLWSRLGMTPDAEVHSLLRDYASFFFGPSHADAIAEGILALERNWEGALAINSNVDATLQHWKKLEAAEPRLTSEWRGQMLLVRAEYDAFLRRRLLAETEHEAAWNAAVAAGGPEQTSDAGLQELRAHINACAVPPGQAALRSSIEARYETLFEQIALQSSVQRHQASGAERGCSLDFVDYPLNNRWWIEDELDAIRRDVPESDAEERRRHLLRIALWESAGEGGFYDALGHPGKSPRVQRDTEAKTYPDLERSIIPTQWWWDSGMSRKRLTWQTSMDWPSGLLYEGLDSSAQYMLRCTGYGEALPKADGVKLQATMYGKEIGEIKEFLIPRQSTEDGALLITWTKPPGEEHLNWRQQSRVSEVWLVKRGASLQSPP